MPPKKATPKPTSDDNVATGLILEYLVSQNRPYSATEISSNLHNAVTKTRTDKLLKEMFERTEIGGRASGKQWVYWAIQVSTSSLTTQTTKSDEGSQDPEASCSKEELAAYDTEIATLRDAIPALKAELKNKQGVLATIRSAPSTDSLRAVVSNLEAKKAEAEQRLQTLRSGSVKPVSDVEKDEIAKEHRKWKGTRERRKRG